jgi:hypothetical protein
VQHLVVLCCFIRSRDERFFWTLSHETIRRHGPRLRCCLYFYNPDKDYVTGFNLVNKIVAGLSPPFSHVELQFPFGMACSIVMNETVRIRESTFDPEFYTGVVLHAPPQAVFKMLALTQLHVERGIPFGVIAGHTFCSKLVAELLRVSTAD